MHEFTVWAPDAGRVLLHLPAVGPMHRQDMRRTDDGWWHTEVEDAGHGTDYAYAVDGADPRPDPRSPWQPAGVHAPSRVFVAGRHEWQDDGWPGRAVDGSVFYELHVGTFTPAGTFDAAIERLDHLMRLGVDVVELLPVAGSPGPRGWGYDGVDLYAVHEPYGGPGGLQRFVDACHARGLGVCLDVVYNHLGPDGNYLRDFGPYFSAKHQTPWGEAINLDDTGSAGVRAFIVDNALRWFTEFHVDCLRLDAVHALVDSSPRHILVELSDTVAERAAKLGRPLGLVAESDLNDPRTIEPTSSGGRPAGGLGMTAQWDDDVHHALHAWLTGETFGYYCDFGSTEVLGRVLTQAFRHAGDYSSFRKQNWGRPVHPAVHRGHRFVVATQTHDQVGNRAAGDRPSATLSPGRLAASAALILTSPFTPMLFMGEEWGARTPWQFFTSFESEELAEAVRTGRRGEFAGHGGPGAGWDADDVPDPQAQSTRDASVLDWDEPDSQTGAAMLDWYRSLIALRRATPDLLSDDLAQVHVETGLTWIVVHRGAYRVAVNIGPDPAALPLPDGAEVLLGWGLPDGFGPGLGQDHGLVPPDGVAVVRVTSP